MYRSVAALFALAMLLLCVFGLSAKANCSANKSDTEKNFLKEYPTGEVIDISGEEELNFLTRLTILLKHNFMELDVVIYDLRTEKSFVILYRDGCYVTHASIPNKLLEKLRGAKA